MKKPLPLPLRAAFVLLLVLGQGVCAGFGPPQLAARDFDSTALWPEQVRELVAVGRQPQVDAKAALLIDMGSKAVLYEKNGTRRLPQASTTKMMTALVALERGNLSDTVVIEPGDLVVASAAGLRAGEMWTLGDLLYALMLPSDNAAAVVIARHVGGSEAAFVDMMNSKAAEWGLTDTHFANPHGLDDPAHHSSARDLAQIAMRGLAEPRFAAIVSTAEREAGGRTLRNLNQLLGSYVGAEGVKTGTTEGAGQCLVALAGRGERRVLSVVLGSDDRYRDTRALLDYYYANYRTVPLDLGPKGINVIRRSDGSKAVLALEGQPTALLPLWQLPWLQVLRVTPGAEGTAGMARFVAGGTLLAEEPLNALSP